tara:strand:+ start:135 stop:434 length:300 start_codon:yes stop_codon:yes gene_type:complete
MHELQRQIRLLNEREQRLVARLAELQEEEDVAAAEAAAQAAWEQKEEPDGRGEEKRGEESAANEDTNMSDRHEDRLPLHRYISIAARPGTRQNVPHGRH